MILIGSTAIKYYFPDFNRVPKDLDIATQVKMVNNIPNIEYLENPLLFEDVDSSWDILNINNHNYRLLPKDYLYTLKISHCFWDINWEKHMWDAQFLKEKGCIFIPELFYKLFNYWEITHGLRNSSKLNMTANDFFNNALPNSHEHDVLHELLIKHSYFNQEEPTYKKVLKDDAEVDVDVNKFNLLSEKEKFNLAFEEVAIMSWEKGRFPESMFWKRKYTRMLKKFILSHCPIWEGIWIIQNHKSLINPPFDFNEHLNKEYAIRFNKN